MIIIQFSIGISIFMEYSPRWYRISLQEDESPRECFCSFFLCALIHPSHCPGQPTPAPGTVGAPLYG